eukprot:4714680-Pleurochrysis_carterae.AAC.1
MPQGHVSRSNLHTGLRSAVLRHTLSQSLIALCVRARRQQTAARPCSTARVLTAPPQLLPPHGSSHQLHPSLATAAASGSAAARAQLPPCRGCAGASAGPRPASRRDAAGAQRDCAASQHRPRRVALAMRCGCRAWGGACA